MKKTLKAFSLAIVFALALTLVPHRAFASTELPEKETFPSELKTWLGIHGDEYDEGKYTITGTKEGGYEITITDASSLSGSLNYTGKLKITTSREIDEDITGSQITIEGSGTFTGNIADATINGGTFNTGTVSNAKISAGTFSGTVTGGEISGGTFSSVTGSKITGGAYSRGTFDGVTIEDGATFSTGATVQGDTTINGGTFNDGASVTAKDIKGGDFKGDVSVSAGGTITSGTFAAYKTVTATGATIKGGAFSGTVSGGTIDGGTYSSGTFTGVDIKGGTFNSGASVSAKSVEKGTFDVDVTVESSGTVTDGTFNKNVTATGATVNGGKFAGTVTGGTLAGGEYTNEPSADNVFEAGNGKYYVKAEDAVTNTTAGQTLTVKKANSDVNITGLADGATVKVEDAAQSQKVTVDTHEMTPDEKGTAKEGYKKVSASPVPGPSGGSDGSARPGRTNPNTGVRL